MKTRTFIAAGLAVHARTIATTRPLIFRRGWLWTGFLAFATIALGPRPAQAAVTEAWVQRYSPALTDPWSTIHTQITPASGLLEYLDTLPHPGSGFYRIVQP